MSDSKYVQVSIADISEYSKYTLESLQDLWSTAKNKAEELNMSNWNLYFRSTMEPYEDFPGDVEVLIEGVVPKTEKDKKEDRKNAEIVKLSKEKGITIYEAKNLKNLMDRGIV